MDEIFNEWKEIQKYQNLNSQREIYNTDKNLLTNSSKRFYKIRKILFHKSTTLAIQIHCICFNYILPSYTALRGNHVHKPTTISLRYAYRTIKQYSFNKHPGTITAYVPFPYIPIRFI
jgi:hypothetical protein